MIPSCLSYHTRTNTASIVIRRWKTLVTDGRGIRRRLYVYEKKPTTGTSSNRIQGSSVVSDAASLQHDTNARRLQEHDQKRNCLKKSLELSPEEMHRPSPLFRNQRDDERATRQSNATFDKSQVQDHRKRNNAKQNWRNNKPKIQRNPESYSEGYEHYADQPQRKNVDQKQQISKDDVDDRPKRVFRKNLTEMLKPDPTTQESKVATRSHHADFKMKRTKQTKDKNLRKDTMSKFQKIPGERKNELLEQRLRHEQHLEERKGSSERRNQYYKQPEIPREEEEQPVRRHPPKHLTLYISCHPGLQNVVYEELNELGYKYTEKGNGILVDLDSMRDVFRCHVWLGAAARIFLHCGELFHARAFGELERKIAKFFPWKDLIGCNGEIPRIQVKAVVSKSRLIHATAVSQRVTRSIYSVVGEPTCSETLHLTLQLHRDMVQLTFDTLSGAPLYRRGYRASTVKAPLREDMAYALLWKSRLREYDVFFDPFCGSGTIPIEAATIAAGIPPGHLLPAPLWGTTMFDEDLWNEVKEERREALDIKVYAADRDHAATEAAKENIQQTDLDITVDKGVFSAHPMWEERDKKVLMVTNPPFGVRLKGPKVEKKRLYNLELYQTLAKRMNTWKDKTRNGAVILTNNRHSWRAAGFKGEFSYMLKFLHGGIAVTALEYDPVKSTESPTLDPEDVEEDEQCEDIVELAADDDVVHL